MDKIITFPKMNIKIDAFKELIIANRKDVYYMASLTVMALCNYRYNPEKCFEMINFLRMRGQGLTDYEKRIIVDRLGEKDYIPFSYFSGANMYNEYSPRRPYSITIRDNSYSFTNEGFAELWVRSNGADNDRAIRFRQKLSTGSWFLTEHTPLLGDIRVLEPDDEDNEHGEDDDLWA